MDSTNGIISIRYICMKIRESCWSQSLKGNPEYSAQQSSISLHILMAVRFGGLLIFDFFFLEYFWSYNSIRLHLLIYDWEALFEKDGIRKKFLSSLLEFLNYFSLRGECIPVDPP